MNSDIEKSVFRANDSLAEQIAAHVAERIIRRELSAGERIQEGRVAKGLDVSRGSVREAFLLLERRHLIEMIPRKGAVVSAMAPETVKQLYETLALLLGKLASKAATSWQGNELVPFVDRIQSMQEHVNQGDVIAFYEASFDLYRAAYRFLDNPFLQQFLEDLLPSIRRSFYFALNQDTQELQVSMQFFREVAEKVTAREAGSVQQVVEVFAYHQRDLVLGALVLSQ